MCSAANIPPMRQKIALMTLVATCVLGTCAAQSLGDVARANRESKKAQGARSTHVFDDEENPLPSRIPAALMISNPPPYSKKQTDAAFERIVEEAAKLVNQLLRGERHPDELPFIVALFDDENALTTAEWRSSIGEYRALRENRCVALKTGGTDRETAKSEALKEQIKTLYRDQTIALRRREENLDKLKGQVSPYSRSWQHGREDLWRLDWTNLQMLRDMELFDMQCDELLSYLKH